jgi:hypothetical protein
MQNHKKLLTKLQPALELKKARKAALEAELRTLTTEIEADEKRMAELSYGPPWAHYLGGYQDRLLGGPLGLPDLRYTAPEGVEHKDNTGVVLG